MKTPESNSYGALAVALATAFANTGCTSTPSLSRLNTIDPNGNGILDATTDLEESEDALDPDLSTSPSPDLSPDLQPTSSPIDFPSRFTLSDLTNECIPEPIDCPPEDADCDAVNETLTRLGRLWADELENFYGEPVDPDPLREGAYDDRMQASGYVWDKTTQYNDEVERYVGGVILAGNYSHAELTYMINTHNFPAPQLKCNAGQLATNEGLNQQTLRVGMTETNGSTWINRTDIEVNTDTIEGQSSYLFYENGEPGYTAVTAWSELGITRIGIMTQRMSTLDIDPDDRLDGGITMSPRATTELTTAL